MLNEAELAAEVRSLRAELSVFLGTHSFADWGAIVEERNKLRAENESLKAEMARLVLATEREGRGGV